MTPLQIVTGARFAADIDLWRRTPGFAAIEDHPVSGAFGRSYYPAVFGERRSDASFAVIEGDRPLVIVPCTSGEGELDYFGVPIRLFPCLGLESRLAARAIAGAFSYLDTLVADCFVRRITIHDDESVGALSLVGKQCLNRRAVAALRLTGLCILDEGEPVMRRGLRKSFQSLVNWGERNLRIVNIGANNPEKSWEVMFDWIAAGHGELVLGFLASGELVTGTMVVDGVTKAFYASGVYDRQRFDQPLGHWPLWLAMLHSAGRRMQVFDIGDLPLPGVATEKKEFDIGYFKRGFATNIATWVSWDLNVSGLMSQS